MTDKLFRRCEREYEKEQRNRINEIRNNDPKAFWKSVEQLGPPNKRDNTIPMTVKTDNGQFSNDIQTVLKKWRNDYKTLFTTKYEAGSVDEELLKTAERTIILDLNDDTQEHQWHQLGFI